MSASEPVAMESEAGLEVADPGLNRGPIKTSMLPIQRANLPRNSRSLGQDRSPIQRANRSRDSRALSQDQNLLHRASQSRLPPTLNQDQRRHTTEFAHKNLSRIKI